jgi:hypothetical protein
MQIERSTMREMNLPYLIRIATKQVSILALGTLLIVQTQATVTFAQESRQDTRRTSQLAKTDPAPPNLASNLDELPSAPEPQSSAQPQEQPQKAQQQNSPQQPVGTAAAPYEKPTGVPGSRPAGAAIAPAKQRRVRAIVIRVGLVLAGAGAVGAVVGLSKASHSQP